MKKSTNKKQKHRIKPTKDTKPFTIIGVTKRKIRIGTKTPNRITPQTLHRQSVIDRKRQIELLKLDIENEMFNSAKLAHNREAYDTLAGTKITIDEAPFAEQFTWNWKNSASSFWQGIKNILNEFRP